MGRNKPASKRGFGWDAATETLDIFSGGERFQKFGGITDLYSESSSKQYEIGTRRETVDGRVFRYCFAATALYCGMGAQDGGVVGLYTLAAGTQAAGSASITIPDTTSAHTVDYWKGGYISVEGWGPWYRRITTSTASNGTTCSVTLDSPTPAAVATNKVNVFRDPYAAVTRGMTLGANTAKIMSHVCVPLLAVTSDYYFWGQTWGPCAGVPVAFFGDLEYERQVILWDTDGAVRASTHMVSAGKQYQMAGYLMGRYTASTDHKVPMYFLMLAP